MYDHANEPETMTDRLLDGIARYMAKYEEWRHAGYSPRMSYAACECSYPCELFEGEVK